MLLMFFAKGLSELIRSFDLARRAFWLPIVKGVKGFIYILFSLSSDLQNFLDFCAGLTLPFLMKTVVDVLLIYFPMKSLILQFISSISLEELLFFILILFLFFFSPSTSLGKKSYWSRLSFSVQLTYYQLSVFHAVRVSAYCQFSNTFSNFFSILHCLGLQTASSRSLLLQQGLLICWVGGLGERDLQRVAQFCLQ